MAKTCDSDSSTVKNDWRNVKAPPEKGRESDTFKRPNICGSVAFRESGHEANGDHTPNVVEGHTYLYYDEATL